MTMFGMEGTIFREDTYLHFYTINKLYLPDCLNWGHLSEKIFTEAVSKIK